MGYSTVTSTNNKIACTNIISQHKSMIAEYSASVTDSVIVYEFNNDKRWLLH